MEQKLAMRDHEVSVLHQELLHAQAHASASASAWVSGTTGTAASIHSTLSTSHPNLRLLWDFFVWFR